MKIGSSHPKLNTLQVSLPFFPPITTKNGDRPLRRVPETEKPGALMESGSNQAGFYSPSVGCSWMAQVRRRG